MTTFSELGIQAEILRSIQELGFNEPTLVQEQVIPIVLNRRTDLLGLAQTGTGKTAAFGIPLIQLIDIHSRRTQTLVLCPTRELCVQVAGDIKALSRYIHGLHVVPVYGGAGIDGQIKELRSGAHIIVATPGRLHDLIRRGAVDISGIRRVVLDEADEMLQMGFQDELNAILATTPADKNTLLFSATMPQGVAEIARSYMDNPAKITIGQPNAGAENIHHIYYMVQARDRFPALRRIVDMNPDIYAIIFCRTRQETKEVADQLIETGYGADALHGDLSQAQRDQVMHKFRSGNLRLLVATDVAARGLDVNDLTHVINYNLPDETANYTHRSGRTGRAGKTGTSVAIIHLRERHKIKEIEKIIKRSFEEGRIPNGNEICRKQLFHLADNVKKVDIAHEQLQPFFAAVARELAELDREELIKRFFSIEFNRLLKTYQDAPDLNISFQGKKQDSRPKREGKSRPLAGEEKFTRFLINVGKKDGVHPARLIGQINDNSTALRIIIGKIEVMNYSSILEAESRFAPLVIKAFARLMINGKDVSIQVVNNAAGDGQPDAKSVVSGKTGRGAATPVYKKEEGGKKPRKKQWQSKGYSHTMLP